MKVVTSKAIFYQFGRDLVGKDAYRGASLTYTLLANQFGHFCLGFIPTIWLYLKITKNGNADPGTYWPCMVVAGTWLVFELFNFSLSLLIPSEGSISWPGIKKFPFTPPWGNLLYDLITDLGFFWLGAVFAASFFVSTAQLAAIYITPFILLLFPLFYWYRAKMYLQEAQYPFQFRLCQWETDISEDNKKIVLEFLNNKIPGKHLLLFGENTAEKTSLCVGIATEMSYRNKSCTYLTAMKLYYLFSNERRDHLSFTANKIWNWQNASLLIIDDINPSHSIKEEIVSPAEFYRFLNDPYFGKRNKKVLKEKNIIWVLGSDDPDKTRQRPWESLLLEIGVDPSNIRAINLC